MINDSQMVWDSCLRTIKKNVSPQSFKTWFEPIRPIQLDQQVLTIQVPNKFFYEWLEEHYVSLLKQCVRQELGDRGRLVYRIPEAGGTPAGNRAGEPVRVTAKPSAEKDNEPVPGSFDVENIKNPFIIPGIKRVKVDPQLNPNYTFDNFIEGDCNRLGRSAGLAVAKKPGGTAFNPLVVYGDVGLGKTHLVQAIGNEILHRNENKAILYVSMEKFTNQIIQAIKNNAVTEFVNFYQLIDVLIIDDVQFFSRAEKSQDAFFAIFNHFHQSGKQLVLTSDKAPKDLDGMQERLLSRFRWGLSADLQVPDYETRIEILEKKMKNDGLDMPKEVIKYVAYNINTNVRELEGALISLLAQSSLNKKEIDVELAKKVLRNFVKTSSKEITIDAIQKMVCEYFDVPYDRLLHKTRKREIVQARQITMYLAKAFTKNSLKTIGEHFGGRDHTTVIHSCQTVKDLMDTDSIFRENVMELTQKVQLAAM